MRILWLNVLRFFRHLFRIVAVLALVDRWVRHRIVFAVAHFTGDAKLDMAIVRKVVGSLSVHDEGAGHG